MLIPRYVWSGADRQNKITSLTLHFANALFVLQFFSEIFQHVD